MVKQVVILGASYAGIGLAHRLLKVQAPKKSIKVTLIAPSTHFYWNCASVRGILPSAIPDKDLFYPVADGFSKYNSTTFEFIEGSAETLDPASNTVTVNGKPLQYDILVIATGASYKDKIPWKIMATYQETLDSLHEYQNRVAKAKSILIAGGGPTGVETAAELGFAYGKEKDITLVTSSDRILSALRPDIGKGAEQQLEKLGVKIWRNASVESSKPHSDGKTEIVLSNDQTVTTDLYLPTIGVTPNTSFVPSNLLDSHRNVVVDEYLRVKDTSNIWAAGDAINIQAKQIVNTFAQRDHLAKNLNLVIDGKGPEALQVYKHDDSKTTMAVTLGRSKGTGQAGSIKLPSLAVWWLKGRAFMVDKAPKLVMGTD